MNTILHILIATTLIAGMILLCVGTDHNRRTGGEGEHTGCCGGCNADAEPDR